MANYTEQTIPAEFYYKNIYPNDEQKSIYIAKKVKCDLYPFNDYLRKSRANLLKASMVKAECFEVKTRVILKPRFSLLKIDSLNSVSIKQPEGYFYLVDWNDDWGDVEGFEAIMQRRNTLFESGDEIDIYNGRLVFKTDEEIDCNQNYKIYFNNSDIEEKCIIRPVDFSDIDNYRIELNCGTATSVGYKDGILNIFYEGAQPSSVKLFNSIDCTITNGNSVEFDESRFSINNSKVKAWINKGFLIADEQVADENPALFYDGQKIEYSIVDKDQLEKIINDNRIRYIDRKLEIVDPSFGNIGEKVKIQELPFEIMTLGDKVKKQYHNLGSVIVELVEDDSFHNDIYSNVSFFFRETTERVVDENGKRYQIGLKYENYNQIEIVALDNDKKKVAVDVIPKTLTIEPNVRQIQMQLNALRSLIEKPNKYHAPLLELMENKRFCDWAQCNYESIQIPESGWYKLTNINYEGCGSQRNFVKKALATPDFAILEGPPGSGKTTTILEIIAQMIMRGQKVILAASTNAAIDNILERLDALPEVVKDKIIATRIGNESAISDSVDNYKITRDNIYFDEIMDRANLVCGTIIGILQHPKFNLGDQSQPVIPLYDCLIIDEASKTTFQEFLVPALYAKKWILSGDLKQLTPYIDQDNIEASLTQIGSFNSFYQQAQAYLMLLDKEIYRKKDERIKKLKFAIIVDFKVIDSLEELATDYEFRRIGAIGKSKYKYSVSKDDFLAGKGLFVYGADVLFIDKSVYSDVSQFLPEEYIVINNDKQDLTDYQNRSHYKSFEAKIFNSNVKSIEELKSKVFTQLKGKTWAGEIAWRLCRIQELFMLKDIEILESDIVEKYKKDIQDRIPTFATDEVNQTINLLREIALPSVLQLLQKGIDKSVVANEKQTTLNSGFDEDDLRDRHTMVEYQHRMHNDISAFSAKEIYKGEALNNGTVIDRNWNYAKYAKRAVWLQVSGSKPSQNSNLNEVDVIYNEVAAFMKFAAKNKKESGEPWSIACLTYYRKQESELKNKLKKLFSDNKSKSYYKDLTNNVELMIYTVDKFQGKEADIVFLSMIKSGSVGLGFMDSPNRLNVALTRAKYQIVLVGDRNYFKSNNCKSKLLQKVAEVY